MQIRTKSQYPYLFNKDATLVSQRTEQHSLNRNPHSPK